MTVGIDHFDASFACVIGHASAPPSATTIDPVM
jgi:hypothetical protein